MSSLASLEKAAGKVSRPAQAHPQEDPLPGPVMHKAGASPDVPRAQLAGGPHPAPSWSHSRRRRQRSGCAQSGRVQASACAGRAHAVLRTAARLVPVTPGGRGALAVMLVTRACAPRAPSTPAEQEVCAAAWRTGQPVPAWLPHPIRGHPAQGQTSRAGAHGAQVLCAALVELQLVAHDDVKPDWHLHSNRLALPGASTAAAACCRAGHARAARPALQMPSLGSVCVAPECMQQAGGGWGACRGDRHGPGRSVSTRHQQEGALGCYGIISCAQAELSSRWVLRDRAPLLDAGGMRAAGEPEAAAPMLTTSLYCSVGPGTPLTTWKPSAAPLSSGLPRSVMLLSGIRAGWLRLPLSCWLGGTGRGQMQGHRSALRVGGAHFWVVPG